MYEYSHGGNAVFETGKKNMIDLSANINPFGMPDNIADAIIGEIPNIIFYPDSFSSKLRESIGLFRNIDPDWIICGNGASDIIFRIPRAVQAKKVLLCAPTFSDYERAARSFGSEVVLHGLSPANDFTLDRTCVSTVQREKPDLVFICNPNNPTGKLTDIGLIKELLEYCKQINAVVVIDECFMDFVNRADEYTSIRFLFNYPNLIILKAFTKMMGLPGIRLGYAICANKDLIDRLYFHGPDWSVSNLAQAAGLAAVAVEAAFIRQTVSYVSSQRAMVENGISQLGYKIFSSEANYVFFQSPYPFDLREALDEKGIRIRACGNYHGLDASYYRIAVSTEENNIKLLSALQEI